MSTGQQAWADEREAELKREAELIKQCARVAHTANASYCKSIGDNSQSCWELAEKWQRDSAIEGVKGVLRGNTPEQSHECWLEVKERDGWVFGEKKDPELKTHPCMVPYSELPEEQRAKDDVFVSVVRVMVDALGLAG